MNKNIIIAILVVIIIAVAAFALFGNQQQPAGKVATQISFLSNDTLQNGEQVQFQLKDAKGNALAGENVNITFNNKEKYSINTDKDGKGYLTIKDEEAGTYDITVDYAGNGTYDGCSAKVTITVEEGEADTPAEETEATASANSGTNGSSSTNLTYDSENDYYVDDNGIIHAPGTIYDGMTVDEFSALADDLEDMEDGSDSNYDQNYNTMDDYGSDADAQSQ